jgi:hypothetical protein
MRGFVRDDGPGCVFAFVASQPFQLYTLIQSTSALVGADAAFGDLAHEALLDAQMVKRMFSGNFSREMLAVQVRSNMPSMKNFAPAGDHSMSEGSERAWQPQRHRNEERVHEGDGRTSIPLDSLGREEMSMKCGFDVSVRHSAFWRLGLDAIYTSGQVQSVEYTRRDFGTARVLVRPEKWHLSALRSRIRKSVRARSDP